MATHENFFLYDNENMITETYVSELNEKTFTQKLRLAHLEITFYIFEYSAQK